MCASFFCPNCGSSVSSSPPGTARFPFCTRCKIVARKRPPRRRQVREEIDLTHKGAALCLHYESTVRAARIPHQDDAFFELIAGLMNAHPLTELSSFANTQRHGTQRSD